MTNITKCLILVVFFVSTSSLIDELQPDDSAIKNCSWVKEESACYIKQLATEKKCQRIVSPKCMCHESGNSKEGSPSECVGAAKDYIKECADSECESDQCDWTWNYDKSKCQMITDTTNAGSPKCAKRKFQECKCATGCQGEMEQEQWVECDKSECAVDPRKCWWEAIKGRCDKKSAITVVDTKPQCERKVTHECKCDAADGTSSVCEEKDRPTNYVEECKPEECEKPKCWLKKIESRCTLNPAETGECKKLISHKCICMSSDGKEAAIEDGTACTMVRPAVYEYEEKCDPSQCIVSDKCAWEWQSSDKCFPMKISNTQSCVQKRYQKCVCEDGVKATCAGQPKDAVYQKCADSDGCPVKPHITLKLMNRDPNSKVKPSYGVILGAISRDLQDESIKERWGFLCTDGFGRYEADAVCRAQGFKMGRNIPSAWVSKDLPKLRFKLTNMACPKETQDPNDCKFQMLKEAKAPCFAGQEASLVCFNSDVVGFSFELKAEEKFSKKGKKVRGFFRASFSFKRYGMPLRGLSRRVDLTVFSRTKDGKYHNLNVKFKLNPKTGIVTGIRKTMKNKFFSKRCIIFVARLDEKISAIRMGSCTYKDLTEETIRKELKLD